MTTKFKIQWPSGLIEEAESETTSLEAYAMERWGANALSDLEEYGVSISLVGDAAEPPTANVPANTEPPALTGEQELETAPTEETPPDSPQSETTAPTNAENPQ